MQNGLSSDSEDLSLDTLLALPVLCRVLSWVEISEDADEMRSTIWLCYNRKPVS